MDSEGVGPIEIARGGGLSTDALDPCDLECDCGVSVFRCEVSGLFVPGKAYSMNTPFCRLSLDRIYRMNITKKQYQYIQKRTDMKPKLYQRFIDKNPNTILLIKPNQTQYSEEFQPYLSI